MRIFYFKNLFIFLTIFSYHQVSSSDNNNEVENEDELLLESEEHAQLPLPPATTTVATFDEVETTTNGTTLEGLLSHFEQVKKVYEEKFHNLTQEILQLRANSSNSAGHHPRVTGELDSLREEIEKLKSQLVGQNETTTVAPVSEAAEHKCGDILTISASNRHVTLFYKNPGTIYYGSAAADDVEETSKTCVWLIARRPIIKGPMNFTLTSVDLVKNSTSALSLQQLTTINGPSTPRPITDQDKGIKFTINETHTLIVFRSTNSNESFQLDIFDLTPGHTVDSEIKGQFIEWSPEDWANERTLSYPLNYYPGSQYLPNERRFMVIKSFPNKKILVSMTRLSTEETHDYLLIMKFSKMENKFVHLRTFTGSSGNLKYEIFDGEVNQPILLYFHSDGSVQSSGFSLKYSYILPNATLKTVWNDVIVQNTFDQCGGLVELPSVTQVTYQVPQDEGNEGKICVWLIQALNQGPTAYMLDSSNFTFSPNNSQSATLTLINSGMFTDRFMESRQINSTGNMVKPVLRFCDH